MRKTFALVVALGMATVAGAQYKVGTATPNAKGSPVKITNGAPGEQINPAEALKKIRRISIDEAIELVEQDKAVYVDVRSREQFDLGHIKGALSIPNSQLLERLREVPPGKTVITYCACSAEQTSGQAIITLNAHGFKNAAALTGGYNLWKQMNLPTQVNKR